MAEMANELEIWKDIEGYEGLYKVSNLGRVKSLDRFTKSGRGNGIRLIKGRILKGGKANNYQFVNLKQLDSSQHNHYIHRLVAQAFIPNPDNKPCIDHIDTNPANNTVENLQWVTHKENMNNPLTKEKSCIGTKKYLSEHPHPNLGRICSIETKQKISKANTKFTKEELQAHRKDYVNKNREKNREYWRNYKRKIRNAV